MTNTAPGAPLDEHLDEIKTGADAARAFQLIAYGAAVLVLVLTALDLAVDLRPGKDWWSMLDTAVNLVIVGGVLGFVRRFSLTMVRVVEDLRTTV